MAFDVFELVVPASYDTQLKQVFTKYKRHFELSLIPTISTVCNHLGDLVGGEHYYV